jgi:hypothetical protein
MVCSVEPTKIKGDGDMISRRNRVWGKEMENDLVIKPGIVPQVGF